MPQVSLVSKCSIFPSQISTLGDLKLSVSDLLMLYRQYIQRGCLFTLPPFPITQLISLLKISLSNTLTQFPPLAGRLITDSDGFIYITCNDAGVDFYHSIAPRVRINDILGSVDVPEYINEFFALNGLIGYDAHLRPIAAVQVTELADGVFIGCSVSHAVVDGTSFWNFFNNFADATRGVKRVSLAPDFSRESPLISSVALKFTTGRPPVISLQAPLRVRIFSFSRESISKLKAKANLQNNISLKSMDAMAENPTAMISSFQALCALLWRGVTRARKLPDSQKMCVRMAVNCRQRLQPKLDPLYFGNAFQMISTYATAGDVLDHDLHWCAEKLNENVIVYDNDTVKKAVKDWERDPRCFTVGKSDGTILGIGSSSRFPVYDNDFGWGRPVAIRKGLINNYDGKVLAFQGRDGSGTIDLEVVLTPSNMSGLESDQEFMQYVSIINDNRRL